METGYTYYSWLRTNYPHDFPILEAFCKSHSDAATQNAFMADLQLNGWLPAYTTEDGNDTTNRRDNCQSK